MNNEFFELEKAEYIKRDKELDFIASQNLCSEEVLEACSSIAQMKYAEGFPGKRYYAGCEVVDLIETRCEEELIKLFKADGYKANVQPANGSSANFIAYRALLNKDSKVLAPSTDMGGHISHGHPLSTIAEFYNVITYGLDSNGEINYEQMEFLALHHNVDFIIVGMSNYSRHIDYERVKYIADKVGAKVMADIAHISGLIASGLHPSPVGYADVITSTTHKILRGPRSAFILYKEELDKRIKRATIPGCFGGPDEAKIMAKLLCFKEAQTPEYKEYCTQVVANAKAMVKIFNEMGIPVLTGGTDNHSFCLDISEFPLSGRELANTLSSVGIITNCNSVPNDKRSFFETSGVRMGTPSVTTRGLKEEDCEFIAILIADYLNALKEENSRKADSLLDLLGNNVKSLTEKYQLKYIYSNKYNKLFK